MFVTKRKLIKKYLNSREELESLVEQIKDEEVKNVCQLFTYIDKAFNVKKLTKAQIKNQLESNEMMIKLLQKNLIDMKFAEMLNKFIDAMEQEIQKENENTESE